MTRSGAHGFVIPAPMGGVVAMIALGQALQICHTRCECAVVLPVFTRDHDGGSCGGVCWLSGRGRQLNALLGSRHASLYPPSRCRTTPHYLPKLCATADVYQGRRTALDHGEDRLHL